MKKILIFVITIFLVQSCTEDTSNVSTVTQYPTFTYEKTVSVALGEDFTPNVQATENGESIEVTVSGAESVDTSTVGVYTVTYSATNSDGFDGTVSQDVVVHDPSIVGTDVSGNIRDVNTTSRTGVISLVEGTTSIFYCTDFAFASAFPMYFQMDGDVISNIPQTYSISAVESVDLGYDPNTKHFTTKINPQGYEYEFEYY